LKAVVTWVEEERKLFISQRNVYQNSFLVPDAAKKPLRLKFPEKTAVMLLLNAVVAGLRKNFLLSKLKVKLTFIAC